MRRFIAENAANGICLVTAMLGWLSKIIHSSIWMVDIICRNKFLTPHSFFYGRTEAEMHCFIVKKNISLTMVNLNIMVFNRN